MKLSGNVVFQTDLREADILARIKNRIFKGLKTSLDIELEVISSTRLEKELGLISMHKGLSVKKSLVRFAVNKITVDVQVEARQLHIKTTLSYWKKLALFAGLFALPMLGMLVSGGAGTGDENLSLILLCGVGIIGGILTLYAFISLGIIQGEIRKAAKQVLGS